MASLTDHLQQGGGHQIAVRVPDLIHPIVPGGQPGYDHLVGGAVPAQRDEAPVAHVVVCDVALAEQLDGAARGLRVEGAQGGFVRVSGGGKSEVGVRDGKEEGQV